MEITLYRPEGCKERIEWRKKSILKLDPISWWEGNSTKLALMVKLVKVYLLTLASTADLERLLTVPRRICRPHRSRLNPKTIVFL